MTLGLGLGLQSWKKSHEIVAKMGFAVRKSRCRLLRGGMWLKASRDWRDMGFGFGCYCPGLAMGSRGQRSLKN